MVAAGSHTPAATTTLTGAVAYYGAGAHSPLGSCAVGGTSTTIAQGQHTAVGTAEIAGQVSFGASAVLWFAATADLAGFGALTIGGQLSIAALATALGEGFFTGDGTPLAPNIITGLVTVLLSCAGGAQIGLALAAGWSDTGFVPKPELGGIIQALDLPVIGQTANTERQKEPLSGLVITPE